MHEERAFEDGEHKARPLEHVRGADVYVLQSLYEDEAYSVNDKLVRLLFFLGGAARRLSRTRDGGDALPLRARRERRLLDQTGFHGPSLTGRVSAELTCIKTAAPQAHNMTLMTYSPEALHASGPLRGPQDALLIVDVQCDFLPGGALGVADGDAVVPVLNRYVTRAVEVGAPVFASCDWHPENHCSFRHPLQRIVDIVKEDGGLLVTTTDVHLAHGIGEALHHAYKGALDSHYDAEEKLLRVRWRR